MDIIDKTTKSYINATDAEVEDSIDAMIAPDNASIDQGRMITKRRKRPEEVQYFLKQNTLAALERIANIAQDQLYMRDEQGMRIRTPVPIGVQLQAAIHLLDRAMGKPQVNVDMTSGDRPIVFDTAYAAPPLIQGIVSPNVDNEPEDDDDI